MLVAPLYLVLVRRRALREGVRCAAWLQCREAVGKCRLVRPHETEHLGRKPASRAGRKAYEHDSRCGPPGSEYELAEVLILSEQHAALAERALDYGAVLRSGLEFCYCEHIMAGR